MSELLHKILYKLQQNHEFDTSWWCSELSGSWGGEMNESYRWIDANLWLRMLLRCRVPCLSLLHHQLSPKELESNEDYKTLHVITPLWLQIKSCILHLGDERLPANLLLASLKNFFHFDVQIWLCKNIFKGIFLCE